VKPCLDNHTVELEIQGFILLYMIARRREGETTLCSVPREFDMNPRVTLVGKISSWTTHSALGVPTLQEFLLVLFSSINIACFSFLPACIDACFSLIIYHLPYKSFILHNASSHTCRPHVAQACSWGCRSRSIEEDLPLRWPPPVPLEERLSSTSVFLLEASGRWWKAELL
jgi:hypothetical protein